MIDISLLSRPQTQQARFLTAIVKTIVIGLLLVALVHSIFAVLITNIQEENLLLAQEADAIYYQLSMIDKMIEQKKLQLTHLQSLQHIQDSDLDLFAVLDELKQLMPDGVLLITLEKNDDVITIKGETNSDEHIQQLMARVAKSQWVQTPVVKTIEIDKENNNTRRFEVMVLQRDSDLVTRRIHRHVR